jgi:aryl-alcohol dehydrogenase-like predicted oxidoreductase
MITRRQSLKFGLASLAALGLPAGKLLASSQRGSLITRAIPSSGQQIPVVGLGSSATFSQVARSEDVSALREVMAALLEQGGTVFDTAPSYGESEKVAGDIARELDAIEKVFWATKLNVAARGGGSADPAAARAQIETSFTRLAKRPIDLIQVHNLGDLAVQLPILKELKADGRIRHLGVTTTNASQYERLVQVMRSEPLDFIGIDYAIDNRVMEEAVLPLAAERGIAVMVYLPFGRTRLWERVRGQSVPDWAAEFDATSWAQFFLKFVLAHPAVTVVTPATSKAKHMVDNMGAAYGRLPDPDTRKRMVAHIESLG